MSHGENGLQLSVCLVYGAKGQVQAASVSYDDSRLAPQRFLALDLVPVFREERIPT